VALEHFRRSRPLSTRGTFAGVFPFFFFFFFSDGRCAIASSARSRSFETMSWPEKKAVFFPCRKQRFREESPLIVPHGKPDWVAVSPLSQLEEGRLHF